MDEETLAAVAREWLARQLQGLDVGALFQPLHDELKQGSQSLGDSLRTLARAVTGERPRVSGPVVPERAGSREHPVPDEHGALAQPRSLGNARPAYAGPLARPAADIGTALLPGFVALAAKALTASAGLGREQRPGSDPFDRWLLGPSVPAVRTFLTALAGADDRLKAFAGGPAVRPATGVPDRRSRLRLMLSPARAATPVDGSARLPQTRGIVGGEALPARPGGELASELNALLAEMAFRPKTMPSLAGLTPAGPPVRGEAMSSPFEARLLQIQRDLLEELKKVRADMNDLQPAAVMG
jgi:hypothetical protein